MTFDDGSWGSAPEESFTTLDHYLDAGGNFVDTANHYNGGASEETLSTYFTRNPGKRDRPVLATKFGGTVTTASLRGWESLAALQVEYSLLARTVEGEQLGAARALGLGVTPWSPLASGVLSGKYSRNTTQVAGSRRTGYATPQLTESTFALLDELGTSRAAPQSTASARTSSNGHEPPAQPDLELQPRRQSGMTGRGAPAKPLVDRLAPLMY